MLGNIARWMLNSLLPDDAPTSTIGDINAIVENADMLHENAQRWYREARKEGRVEGREEGRKEERLAVARKMLSRGRPVEEIMEDTGLTADEIRALLH